jgi:hypothetical protein
MTISPIGTLFMVTRYLVISPISRMQGQMVQFSKSGNPADQGRVEIEDLSTAFHDRAKDIHESHYATPEHLISKTHPKNSVR